MIELRSYSPSLKDAFLGWMRSDPELALFIGKSFPDSVWSLDRLFDCFTGLPRIDPPHFAWAAVDGEAGLVCHVELKRTAKVASGELELVYATHRQFRCRGFATASVCRALAAVQGLSSPTPSAIVAFVNPTNVPSMRVLEKAGFSVRHSSSLERVYAQRPWQAA